jgi:hypothetical protein
VTRNEAETVAGDPQVKELADREDTRKVEERSERHDEREPPGKPAESAEAVIDTAVRGDEVHFFEEPPRFESRLGGWNVGRVAGVGDSDAAEPVEATDQRDAGPAEGASPVVEQKGGAIRLHGRLPGRTTVESLRLPL